MGSSGQVEELVLDKNMSKEEQFCGIVRSMQWHGLWEFSIFHFFQVNVPWEEEIFKFKESKNMK